VGFGPVLYCGSDPVLYCDSDCCTRPTSTSHGGLRQRFDCTGRFLCDAQLSYTTATAQYMLLSWKATDTPVTRIQPPPFFTPATVSAVRSASVSLQLEVQQQSLPNWPVSQLLWYLVPHLHCLPHHVPVSLHLHIKLESPKARAPPLKQSRLLTGNLPTTSSNTALTVTSVLFSTTASSNNEQAPQTNPCWFQPTL
jgi:hypothetical protein